MNVQHRGAFHPSKPIAYGSSKAVVRSVVDAAGGPKQIAARIGRAKTAVYAWADPDHPAQAPWGAIQALTSPTNRAAAEDLAARAGCVLLPVTASARGLSDLAAASAREHGEFLAAIISRSGGKAELLREIDDVIRVLAEARATLTTATDI